MSAEGGEGASAPVKSQIFGLRVGDRTDARQPRRSVSPPRDEVHVSNRHAYETTAIEQLLAVMEEQGRTLRVMADHVASGRKNCDFLLAPASGAGRGVAVEVVRIIDDPADMETHYRRSIHSAALRAELGRVNVSGLTVRTPWAIRGSPRELKLAAPGLARRIQAAVAAEPDAELLYVDGHEVVPAPGLEGVVTSAHSTVSYVDRPQLAEKLMATLEDKDAQLAVPEVERAILAVAWDTSLEADGVIREIARRTDLSRLRNADRVYFIGHDNLVRLIYARELRDYFDAGGPMPSDLHELQGRWFGARLGDNRVGTLELVRSTLAGQGSMNFLTTDAREALAHHGTHLVENGRLEEGGWIVDQLRADLDPPTDTHPPSGGICTVRGSIAWLTHRLAAAVPHDALPPLVAVTEALANDPNMYVREMAAFPLRVLMARRDQLNEGGYVLPDGVRADIKRVWRAYVDGAAAAGLQDPAASTLDYVFDLAEDEVAHVIDELVGGVDSDGMRSLARCALYFSQLRPTDPGVPGRFVGAGLRERVRAVLCENPRFADACGFVLFRSMKDHPESCGAMAELVPVLLGSSEGGAAGFAVECAGMLAVQGTITADAEDALFRCLERSRTLGRPARMTLAFRLAEAVAALAGAGMADKGEEWLSRVSDEELLAFVERSPARRSGVQHRT